MRPAGIAAPARIAAVVLALGLAACSGDDGPAPPCPEVVSLRDAARLVEFRESGRDLTDVRFQSRIAGTGLSCDYEGEEGERTVAAEMRVAFDIEKGPASREGTGRLRYFIAIADRERNVVAREEFPLTFSLEGNQTRARVVDTVSPRIPLQAGETGASYRIYVGFALDEKQLQYNRRNPL